MKEIFDHFCVYLDWEFKLISEKWNEPEEYNSEAYEAYEAQKCKVQSDSGTYFVQYSTRPAVPWFRCSGPQAAVPRFPQDTPHGRH